MNHTKVLRYLWLTILSLAVWSYGPLFSFDHWYPLLSESSRLMVIAFLIVYVICRSLQDNQRDMTEKSTLQKILLSQIQWIITKELKYPREVILVVGPPNSGKTSYIQRVFKPKFIHMNQDISSDMYQWYTHDGILILEVKKDDQNPQLLTSIQQVLIKKFKKRFTQSVIVLDLPGLLNLSEQDHWMYRFQAPKIQMDLVISHMDQLVGYHEVNRYLDAELLAKQLNYQLSSGSPEQQMNQLIRQFNHKLENIYKLSQTVFPSLKTQMTKHNLFEFPAQLYSILPPLKKVILLISAKQLKQISLTHLAQNTPNTLIDGALSRVHYPLPMLTTSNQLKTANLAHCNPILLEPVIQPKSKKIIHVLLISSLPIYAFAFYLNQQLDYRIQAQMSKYQEEHQLDSTAFLSLINHSDLSQRLLKPLSRFLDRRFSGDVIPQLTNSILSGILADESERAIALRKRLINTDKSLRFADVKPYISTNNAVQTSLAIKYLAAQPSVADEMIAGVTSLFEQMPIENKLEVLLKTESKPANILSTLHQWRVKSRSRMSSEEISHFDDVVVDKLAESWSHVDVQNPPVLAKHNIDDLITWIGSIRENLEQHHPKHKERALDQVEWLSQNRKDAISHQMKSSYIQSDLKKAEDYHAKLEESLNNIREANTEHRSFLMLRKYILQEQGSAHILKLPAFESETYKSISSTTQYETVEVLLSISEQYIQKVWQDLIVRYHKEKLEDYYPIQEDSVLDLSLNDFDGFFNPMDGVVNIFIHRYIAPFSELNEGVWEPKVFSGHKLLLPDGMMAYLSRAYLIQNTFYPDGHTLGVNFGISADTSAASIRQINLTSQRQNHILYPEQKSASSIHWPTTSTSDSIVMKVDKNDEKSLFKTISGPWAIFKFLESASKQVQSNRDQSINMRLMIEDQPIDLTVVSDSPVMKVMEIVLHDLKLP